MKIVTTQQRLMKIFENILLYDSGPKLSSAVVELTPEYLEAKGMFEDSLAYHVRVLKSHFDIFDVPEPTEIVITSSLYKELKDNMSRAEKVSFYNDGELMILKALNKDLDYEEDRVEQNNVLFPIALILDDQKGFLPASSIDKSSLIALINVGQLKQLPSAEDYLFEVEGGKFRVVTKDIGTHREGITPKETEKAENFSIGFSGKLLSIIINQFSDDIWLHINSGKPSGIIISQKRPDGSLTYIQSALG